MDFDRSRLDPVESAFARLYRARKAAVEGRNLDPSEHRDSLIAEERPVVAAIERKGFDFLGVGAGRVVFGVPNTNFVVKAARYGIETADDGFAQNENEVSTWAEASDDVNLLPIVDAADDYSWVVTPEVDLLTEVVEDSDERFNIVDSLQAQLFNAEVFVKLLDVREENVGVTDDGTVCLIDYGLSGDESSD